MVGFKLNSAGDVVIENNKIALVEDKALKLQTINQVLRTNQGEWWLNEEEGIDRYCMLVKEPSEDRIRDNINLGLQQVDESLAVTSLELEKIEDRELIVNFTASKNGEDDMIITMRGD